MTSIVHKKERPEPEQEVIVHKTNQRSTNKKKTIFEKKIKQKPTVWGCIDVYRFITVETLASLMKKSIGNLI